MTGKKSKSFLENMGIMAASHLGMTATTMILGILTARYLGPSGKGDVALAMGMGMILAQVLSLGFDGAAPYFLASKRLPSDVVLGSWLITFVIAVGITFGVLYLLFLSFLMQSFFKGITPSLLLLSGLVCPLYMSRLLINSIMTGFQEFFKQTYHNMFILAASLISAVLSLVILRYGPLGYVGMSVGWGFASVICGLFILRTVFPLKPRFSLRHWYTMLRYGLKATLAQVFSLIDLRLDIYIINYFLNSSIVGIYTIAGALANVFWMLPNAVASVLLPRTAAANPEESRKITSLLCRNTLLLTVICGGLFLVVSRPVITLVFGERFASASNALAILMPGVLGQVLSRICFTDCSARGYPGRSTIASAITAMMTIVLDLVLIPKYGMYGAAVASSVSYCTNGLLGVYWHMRLSGNSFSSLVLPRADDLQYYRAVMTRMWGKFQKSGVTA